MKFPFGSISLPGKWAKTFYNEISGQQNFINADSITVAVAINQASAYPFYTLGMSSNEIVDAMYVWDADYFKEQTGANTPLIKHDTVDHFIIWQIKADNRYKIDNHYLFGCEKNTIFSVFISTTKWSPAQKIEFLETAYQRKTIGTVCD